MGTESSEHKKAAHPVVTEKLLAQIPNLGHERGRGGVAQVRKQKAQR